MSGRSPTKLEANVPIMTIAVSMDVKQTKCSNQKGERDGLVVNASDSGSRGRGFEPHLGQTVLCP